MLIQLLPINGLYPAISMHSCGEEVKMTMGLKHNFDEDSNMSVDGNEEDWLKLHDVRLNGSVFVFLVFFFNCNFSFSLALSNIYVYDQAFVLDSRICWKGKVNCRCRFSIG